MVNGAKPPRQGKLNMRNILIWPLLPTQCNCVCCLWVETGFMQYDIFLFDLQQLSHNHIPPLPVCRSLAPFRTIDYKICNVLLILLAYLRYSAWLVLSPFCYSHIVATRPEMLAYR